MKTRARVPSSVTVQAKPRMTQPGDAAEREADRLAEAALDPSRGATAAPLVATPHTTPVMRQVEPEYEEDDDYDVAPKARSTRTPPAPLGFMEALRSSAGGQPLDTGLRTRMERGFGRSFKDVRIHADTVAARLSDRIDARAFTHGRDIYFGAGEYAPGTRAGERLLAHELAHTLQQAPPGRVARAEKKKPRLTNAEIRAQAEERTRQWREEFSARPVVNEAERGLWVRTLKNAIENARGIDATQQPTRLGYLEDELAMFQDDFYAWLITEGKIVVHGGLDTIQLIGDPGRTLEPDDLAQLDTHRSRMRAGTGAYVTFISQRISLAERQREDEEAAETPAEPEAPGTDGLELESPEDQALLEEFQLALAEMEGESGPYDPELLLPGLRELAPEDRQDFYAFARSLAARSAQEGTAAMGPENALALFNALDPVSREALKANREIAQAEPGTTEALPESVRLELQEEAAAQQAQGDNARKIASNLDRIRAKALPAELAKELDGIDFGISPFFDETAMLMGLLAGAGERSTLVKEAGDSLLKEIVDFTKRLQRELEWLALETAAIAGLTVASEGLAAIAFAARIKKLAERLRLAKQLADTLRRIYDTANRVKRVVDLIRSIRSTYPAFLTWYEQATAQYAELQRRLASLDPAEDLEEAIEKQEDELLERLDEQLEGQLGDILEMLYIPEDTPPDELRQILFDIPRGMTALEDAWAYYSDPAQQGRPEFAEVLSIRSFVAGRLLYPFVGLASALIATELAAAFPDRPLEDRLTSFAAKVVAKPNRRKDNRDLFARLNRKRYVIKPSDLEGPLREARTMLEGKLDQREPGAGKAEHWVPGWFKQVVREEIKNINAAFRGRTVPASRKPDKKGAPAPAPEPVPMPPFRVRLRRSAPGDRKLRADLKINPTTPVEVDKVDPKDFDGEGIAYRGTEAPRQAAIRRFLDTWDYDFTQHPGTGDDYIRLRGGLTGTAKHPYLHVAGNFIKKGLDKNAYKPFLGQVIGDERDLPEGYHLSERTTGVNVALKMGLAQQGYQQLGLGNGRQLVEGPGREAPQKVADLTILDKKTQDYDTAASIASMFAPPRAGVPPYKAQRTQAQWTALLASEPDLRRRPMAIDALLGYTVRARASGSALSSRYVPELRDTDDKGHLIARRFGSDITDPYWNLVPMVRRQNQFPGKWFDLESEMAKVYVGKDATGTGYVKFSVKLLYENRKTRRPRTFIATWQAFEGKGSSKDGGPKTKSVEND